MSQVFFNTNNKVGETWSFQTNIGTGDTKDLTLGGISTMLYDMGINESYFKGSPGFALYQPYSGGATGTKTVTLRGRKGIFSDITSIILNSGFPSGHLDMTGWDNSTTFNFLNSPDLTGVTHSQSNVNVNSYSVSNCDITGHLNLTGLTLGGIFWAYGNSNLTQISHASSSNVFTIYRAYSCDLTGTHDVSMLTGLGGEFRVNSNPNLTAITHPVSSQIFTNYNVGGCGLVSLDVSTLSNLGGIFNTSSCFSLTGITFPVTNRTFTSFTVQNCDLTGTLNLTTLTGLGGAFNASVNPNLTSILHTGTSNSFSQYIVNSCDLTGTLDLLMLSGGIQTFQAYSNPNLTALKLPAVESFNAFGCGISGILNLTASTSLSRITAYSNTNLTDVLMPYSTGTFADNFSGINNKAINLNSCKLGYVDFKPLTGATMDTGSTYGASIALQDNTMNTASVNQILVDFDIMSSASPSKWSGVILNIAGTNSAPDGSAGGYNGTAATINLISKGWTVTTN